MSKHGRHRARRDHRWPVAALLTTLALAVAATAALAITNAAETAAAQRSTSSSAAAASGASPVTVPRIAYGRAGHEVTILALVLPPTAPGCGHLVVPGGATYRLAGAWQPTIPDSSGPAATVGQWWWLTGHPLPAVEAADHATLAPVRAGCDHRIAFYVDSSLNIGQMLTELWQALLAGPSPATPLPGTVRAPSPPGVVRL